MYTHIIYGEKGKQISLYHKEELSHIICRKVDTTGHNHIKQVKAASGKKMYISPHLISQNYPVHLFYQLSLRIIEVTVKSIIQFKHFPYPQYENQCCH